MPPPLVVAELPESVELVRLRLPAFQIPPPAVPVELLEKVELVMFRMPNKLKMPPPALLMAVLLERVEFVMLRVAELLKMPPPFKVAVLPEIVVPEMLRVPALLKAPPLPEVFAPETVTPEMLRLPPVSMLKMLKSRVELGVPEELSKPLMIREEEPGPLIVTVPAVPPPVIGVLALIMVGSEALTVLLRELSVIVPVMLKLMMSLPAVVLARIMASLKEVKPSVGFTVSAVVVT